MSKYETLAGDALENHLSGYLVNSWSYSSVSTFARNEKAFERRYIYCEDEKSSANTMSGSAYHKALEFLFECRKEGRPEPSLVELQQEAYVFIEEWPANKWKLGAKTPTVEQCVIEAEKTATFLLESFCKEKDIYHDGVREIVGVEERMEAWLTVNGVDIPLPCHGVADLVVVLDDGSIEIRDHKTRSAYTDEEAVALCFGKQAIIYVLLYEATHPGKTVSSVSFFEDKRTRNRDGSPQIRKHTITMDADTRALYESMVYEPVRRMVRAVSDPDYIYTVNDSDTMTDKAEIYDFWTRTLLCETSEFPNVPEGKKDAIKKRMRKIKDSSAAFVSPKVITDFRRNASAFIALDYSNSNMTREERIENVLRNFRMPVQVEHTLSGYSCDTFLLTIGAGVKISDIYKYRLDIANALDVPNVRIGRELSVYQGKSFLSIEVVKRRDRDLPWKQGAIPEGTMKIPVGVDNYENTVYWDLGDHSAPHMLVCGATGSGKSVFLRSTVEYIKRLGISDVRIIDPKYEFDRYCDEPGFRVVNDIFEAEVMLADAVREMQRRAALKERKPTFIIIDEVADAIDQSRKGKALEGEKSFEENLKMLAQKGRSLGYHIIIATQRASAKIINGDTKVNFPVQVCFRMPKAIDSKVVLDEDGAESLGGQGDGLMRSPSVPGLIRFQGFWHD